MTLNNSIPASFIAGDTVKWLRDLPDYPPSDGWELTYSLVKDGARKEVTATNNGDGKFLLTISATDSADYTAGDYAWQEYVTKDDERYSLGFGRATVKTNFDAAENGIEVRSHVKKTLDALEAMLERKACRDQMSVSVNGRSVGAMSPADLIKWRDLYRAEYKRDLNAEKLVNGMGVSNEILVRFR